MRMGQCLYYIIFMTQKKTVKTTAHQNDDIISKNIFDILDIASIPEDQKTQVLQRMLQIIYQRVVARIMDVLPEDALRNLKLAIDAQDDTTATVLLGKHGLASFSELMTEEAMFLKFEMNTLMKGDTVLAE